MLLPCGSPDLWLGSGPEHPARSVRAGRRRRAEVGAVRRRRIASPSTAYLYNWNMLPVGQQLWVKELKSYIAFPPLSHRKPTTALGLERVKQMGKRVRANGPGDPIDD